MRLFEATFEASAPRSDFSGVVTATRDLALQTLGDVARQQQFVDSFKVGVTLTTMPDKAKFILDVDPTSSYPMSKVHAMIYQTHRCIASLIRTSTSKFSVTTHVHEVHLRNFMRAIPQDDSIFEPRSVWPFETNRQTILDIADWLRKIGPIYEDCFVTLERFANGDEVFDPLTLGNGSIYSALSRDNTNIVLLSPTEKSQVTQAQFESAAMSSDNGIRIPCKVQGSLARGNLHKNVFVDLRHGGLYLNHFVLKRDYKICERLIEDQKRRVFAIVPSYLKYPGLVSDSVLRGEDQTNAMHCGLDTGKTYEMSFMFPCGLSRGVIVPGGKTCVSDAKMIKKKNTNGQQCRFPYEEGVGLDSECCVSSKQWSFLKHTMTMYARQTVAHDIRYSYLRDIYEWYTQNVDRIRAHDTEIHMVYPPQDEEDTGLHNAFLHFKPVVKKLKIYYPPEVQVETFANWYDEVNRVFQIGERYDVNLFFIMPSNARYIDNEHMARAIQDRPKRELRLDLHGALFVDNNPGPTLNAMHGTENFRLMIVLRGKDAERVPDPTGNIGRSGFREDDSYRELYDDPENPDDFNHSRQFERDHVTVRLVLTFDRAVILASASHAFV